ncbi:MAG: class I SAM-dependent methyltransferase [Elusimicrobiota bacterium]|nr:class I SAM-dependent methyltransferase [Elusimicrobiota bacterium]
MSLLSRLRVAWQAYKTRRKMQRQFGRRQDPFGYGSAPYETARLDAMEAALPRRLESVLECGCAEGHFTARLAERAGRVTSVDISTTALGRAKARAPQARYEEADLLVWEPGEDGPYDAVVLGDVLYYLDRPGVAAEFAAFFGRAASWVRPGGRLILAHGFAGPREEAHRRSFRERFEAAGLRLESESVLGAERGGVRCLLSVLARP